MKKNTFSYSYEQDRKYNTQITALLGQLPFFCSLYIHDKRSLHKAQPRTHVAYLSDILHFFTYLCENHEMFKDTTTGKITTEQLDSLHRRDILNYLSHITSYEIDGKVYENTQAGKARKLAALRSLFSYLVGEEKMRLNPAAEIDTPSKAQSDVIYMTTPEQGMLLNNIEKGYAQSPAGNAMRYSSDNKMHIRDMAIVYLFLGTGMRVSELVGLDLSDLNFYDRSVHVHRKGNKEQILFFSSDVEDMLLSYLDYARPQYLNIDDNGEPIEVDALFLSNRKTRLTVRSVQSMLEKYTSYTFKDKTNKRITCHKLRSTYASNLLEETHDPSLVANTLGHNSLEVVSRYGKVKELDRGAIDIRTKK